MAARLTDDTRERIVELARAGHPRNEIARELGVGAATVSKWAARGGATFDRTQVAAATAAKITDNRARRALLSGKLLEDADRLRRRIWEPRMYVQYGGKDFDRAEDTFDEPIPADQFKLAQAASTLLQRHIDLERHDADQGVDTAKSLLAQLGDALGVRQPDV